MKGYDSNILKRYYCMYGCLYSVLTVEEAKLIWLPNIGMYILFNKHTRIIYYSKCVEYKDISEIYIFVS